MPTLFGKSVAAVACLALLVAHWHATKALVPVAILPQPCCLRWQVDLKYGLSQLLHFAKDWAGALCGCPSCIGAIVGDRSLPPRFAERAPVSAPWRPASRRRAGFTEGLSGSGGFTQL